MAKMRHNKSSGPGFHYFQAYSEGKEHTDNLIETEDERLEMKEFVKRYWAEHGAEAKKNAQLKTEREQELRKNAQLKAEYEQEASKIAQPKNESRLPTSGRNKSRKASNTNTKPPQSRKKVALILKAKKIRGRKISIVVDWGLLRLIGTYSIEELREKAKAKEPVDLLSEYSTKKSGELTVNEQLIDRCLQDGEVIEIAWVDPPFIS